jgi:glycosyltransferase involved in cell wall biosynthesis
LIDRARRIRVVLLAPALHAGGSERQMLILAATLPRAEFDVRFIVLAERGELASEAEGLGFPVDQLGLDRATCSGSRPTVRCAMGVARALRRYRSLTRDVDVVDAWLVPAFTFAGLAQPFAGVPVVLAGRRSLRDTHRTRTWYRDAAARLALRTTTALVANSRAAADQTIRFDGIDPAKVHVIRNAVMPAPTLEGTRAELRRRWSLSPDAIVVGNVANYRPGKGHDLLLDAADRLRDRIPELRWAFFGNGPLEDSLVDQIRARDLGSIVALHTGERDARHAYPGFDVAVQASSTEGLPNVVLEAAAAALPIVATDVGGTSEILTTEIDGILVSRGDSRGLADAVARLAVDRSLRDRLGAAARERSRDFSPEKLADETGGLYRRLLERARIARRPFDSPRSGRGSEPRSPVGDGAYPGLRQDHERDHGD